MALNEKKVNVLVIGIVVVLVLFSLYASLVPSAQAQGDAMNDSNRCATVGCYYNSTAPLCQVNSTSTNACTVSNQTIPLSGLFSSSGIVFILMMIGLLIVIIKGYMVGKK